MSDDEDASLGVSDDDLSSTDLSDGDRGAKDTAGGSALNEIKNNGTPPDFGDSPRLLSGYSQTYIVRKQDPDKDQGSNRQVGMLSCMAYEQQLSSSLNCHCNQARKVHVRLTTQLTLTTDGRYVC